MNIGMSFKRTGRGFKGIGPVTSRLLDQVVRKTTLRVEKGAKLRIMLPPKSGRVYSRPGGIPHQASAPGESPATDTGALVNSTKSRFVRKLEGIVAVSVEYAPVLEFGGRELAARPFLRPSTKEQARQFHADCAAAVRKGARG